MSHRGYDYLAHEVARLNERLDQQQTSPHSESSVRLELSEILSAFRSHIRRKDLAMDSTVEGISILHEGTYTYMNPAHARMYDYEPEDLIGKQWYVLYSQAEIERLEREVFPVLPVAGTWTGETRGTSRTGRIVEGEITLTLLDGNGLVCTCHDISERKRVERERYIASRRLGLAAGAAGFGVWELELSSGTMVWDQRMFEIYGLDPNGPPVNFDQWSSLLVEDDRESMIAAAQGLVRGQFESEVSFRIRRRDGEIRYIRSAATVVSGGSDSDDRDAIRLIGVNWDDTRAQTAIAEAQRNAEALRRTNEELIRAARARDEFMATVSHELRTPLNAILGFSELLLEGIHGVLNEKQRRSLSIVDENGRHLLALINDILDLSKIDAGKLSLHYDWAAPSSIADTVKQTFSRSAEEKRISLRVDVPYRLAPLWVDPVRLKQILHNLVSNAVKFTPAGGEVTLRAYDDPSRDALIFEVEDTGIGISPGDIDAIFQPFVQLDAGLERRFGGTGLGLSLVRMLVGAHGGSVAVKSEASLGSRFSIALPRRMAVDPSERVAPRAPDARPPTRPEAPQDSAVCPTVLVAEDNDSNWEFMDCLLSAMGCKAVRASDGAEAVKKAQELAPPLILMDVQMPGMDGLEAIRRIRATPMVGGHTPKILALTALALPGDRERCLLAGAAQYLSKPVDLSVLRATIRTLISANLPSR